MVQTFSILVKYDFFLWKTQQVLKRERSATAGPSPGLWNLNVWGCVTSTAWGASWSCLEGLSNACHGRLMRRGRGRAGEDWEESFSAGGRP